MKITKRQLKSVIREVIEEGLTQEEKLVDKYNLVDGGTISREEFDNIRKSKDIKSSSMLGKQNENGAVKHSIIFNDKSWVDVFVEESKTIEEGMDVFDEYKLGDHVTVQHGVFGGNTIGGNPDESVITKVFYDDEEVAFHTTGDYQTDAEIGGTDNVALLQKTIADLTPLPDGTYIQ